MQTIATQYIPLTPPYPILYYRGTIAMQTGSLVVICEEKRPSDSKISQFIKTRPVVSMGNRERVKKCFYAADALLGGMVWNKVELQNTRTICSSDVQELDEEDLYHICQSARLNDLIMGNSMFSLKVLLETLKFEYNISLNICKNVPKEIDVRLRREKFSTEVVTNQNNQNTLLQIGVPFDSIREMRMNIVHQFMDYMRATKDFIDWRVQDFRFSASDPDDEDMAKLVEKLHVLSDSMRRIVVDFDKA